MSSPRRLPRPDGNATGRDVVGCGGYRRRGRSWSRGGKPQRCERRNSKPSWSGCERLYERHRNQALPTGRPREKSLRSFDFDANPNIDPATINTLASCEWIKKSQPLCLIGDSGTGKSHMLISLGTEAAMKGYRVRYTLATKLVNELVEAADEKQLNKTIARYGRVDLLCIDELGYMEVDRHGAELLFQVLTEREEKNSVAIASNESFGGWTKTFTDPRLCAAIVDRLTFNGTIIETGTDSYRLASTQARAEEPVKAS